MFPIPNVNGTSLIRTVNVKPAITILGIAVLHAALTIVLLLAVGQNLQDAFVAKREAGVITEIIGVTVYLLIGPYLLAASVTGFSGGALFSLTLFCANSLLWALAGYVLFRCVAHWRRQGKWNRSSGP
jgi:small-conductance mechanosensitive channel